VDASVLSTLPDIFDNGYNTNPDARLLGHRPIVSTNPLKFGPYVWQTYKQVDARRRCVGSALHSLFSRGVLMGDDLETVGIWSQNRPGMFHSPLQDYFSSIAVEWQLVEFALHAYNKVGVGLYDTLGKVSVGK
jgi:long-chain acyl-CoA synthetase